MFNIIKAFFWFAVGTVGTVIFAGIFLFIFGQSDRLECEHVDEVTNCTVTHVLLSTVPLPGWHANDVVQATVEESCDDDGCTHRTELRDADGISRPITEVWSDQTSLYQKQAAQINAFLANTEAPTLVIEQKPQPWVLWLLGGLTAMAIIIQGIVLIVQIVRALFGNPGGYSYR